MVIAIISYEPMWKTMKRKGISQYKLLKRGIDHRTLNTLKHGGNITMRTLENICRILDCEAGEVVAFVEDNCVMERVKTGTARSAAAQNDQEGSKTAGSDRV